MKKLNRRDLRKILLHEIKYLKEQSESLAALKKLYKKADQEYERAYKEGGIVGLAFSMIIGLPLESMIAAGNLLKSQEVRQKLEEAYESNGVDAVYALWLNMLSEETGL